MQSKDKQEICNLFLSQSEFLFLSDAEMNQQMNPANVVDGLFAIARGLHAVAKAIRETKNAQSL